MFDVGFSEIVLIAVVALIVIGPQKLPKTARTLGHLFGRLQRYVNEVKADIAREMELEELKKLQQDVQGAARDIEQSVSNMKSELDAGVKNVEAQLNAEALESSVSESASKAGEAQPSAGASTEAAPSPEAPRQASLPGFDKI
jgi:sec-independent protein translocase protein TatB